MAPPSHRFAVRTIVPLLAAGTLAVAAPAATLADAGNSRTTAALATERYLSSYTDPITPSTDDVAVAAERYLRSYGNPHTLAPPAPASTEVATSAGPSWTSAILAGIALAIAAGLAGIAGGRATMRPKLSA
jgi:hypothetical protein